MNAIQVSGAMILGRNTEYRDGVDLTYGKIGGSVVIAGGAYSENVDMTGVEIKGEIVLGSPREGKTTWGENSMLILRNARADAIQDLSYNWPQRMDLTGFIYRGFGNVSTPESKLMAERPFSWFQDWLGKQTPYTAAPYEQLATVLRSYGRASDADEILYASKQREHSQAPFFRYIWLSVVNWLIGYGHHIERALFWVAGFIIAGILVLRLSGEGAKNGIPYGITYSFDMLLPIIKLRKIHDDIDLQGWPRYYFYVHKIMGYVLASFLIAGIAGLTK